jgi:hypothetical protein
MNCGTSNRNSSAHHAFSPESNLKRVNQFAYVRCIQAGGIQDISFDNFPFVLTRVQTQLIHQMIAATRATADAKFRASLS